MRDANIFIFFYACDSFDTAFEYYLLFGIHCHNSTTVTASKATYILCNDEIVTIVTRVLSTSAHRKILMILSTFSDWINDILNANHFFYPFVPSQMILSICKLPLTRHAHLYRPFLVINDEFVMKTLQTENCC